MLSDRLVLKARTMVRDGHTIQAVARKLVVNGVTLGHAVRGYTWRHLDEQSPPVRRTPKATAAHAPGQRPGSVSAGLPATTIER